MYDYWVYRMTVTLFLQCVKHIGTSKRWLGELSYDNPLVKTVFFFSLEVCLKVVTGVDSGNMDNSACLHHHHLNMQSSENNRSNPWCTWRRIIVLQIYNCCILSFYFPFSIFSSWQDFLPTDSANAICNENGIELVWYRRRNLLPCHYKLNDECLTVCTWMLWTLLLRYRREWGQA